MSSVTCRRMENKKEGEQFPLLGSVTSGAMRGLEMITHGECRGNGLANVDRVVAGKTDVDRIEQTVVQDIFHADLNVPFFGAIVEESVPFHLRRQDQRVFLIGVLFPLE